MSNTIRILSTFAFFVTAMMLAGCRSDIVEAELQPRSPDETVSMRFSPKAAAVPLTDVDGGLEGSFALGSSGAAPVRVRLDKSAGAEYFDVLMLDANRDGTFGVDESLSTEPNEVRNKMWSSFDAELMSMVVDSASGKATDVPYPLSLWYVEDLREEQTEHALRYTRRGWFEGRVRLGGVDAHIRLADANLDGQITLEDDWALAEPDSATNIYDVDHDRPAKRHAWVGDRAYRLVSVDPTGRAAQLAPIDPGVTRAKERDDDDQLAVDRRAPHSGRSVTFETDFEAAENRARERGLPLFIDFETTWCGPCKTMEEWVYSADSVVAASENVISVKVDGDERPDLAERFEVTGYPTMLLIRPGSQTSRLVGYQGVDAMTAFLSR